MPNRHIYFSNAKSGCVVELQVTGAVPATHLIQTTAAATATAEAATAAAAAATTDATADANTLRLATIDPGKREHEEFL